MPRNKSEKIPGREQIVAYGKALRAILDDPTSYDDSQLTDLWRSIPMDAREPLIDGASRTMGDDILIGNVTTAQIQERYANYIEKHYAT